MLRCARFLMCAARCAVTTHLPPSQPRQVSRHHALRRHDTRVVQLPPEHAPAHSPALPRHGASAAACRVCRPVTSPVM